MRIRTYSELQSIIGFENRYDYLRIGGAVGADTFGFDRYINQAFYRSKEWKDVRREVIVRDNGCDLAVVGREITIEPLVHHMNPMSVDDIVHFQSWILDPEYLILTCHDTHNAIHYGNRSLLPKPYQPRSPGDTKLW